MRGNIPEVGMIDVEWLRFPTGSQKHIPKYIKRRFPMVDDPALLSAFVKLSRKQVTFIVCPDVAEAAVAIPFLVGVISAGNAEKFKMIIAQKMLTHHTVDMWKKMPFSPDDTLSPVKLSLNPNDRDANLKIATFPTAYSYIEEAINTPDPHLTHLVIEGFDGENSLDMELLSQAIRLTEVHEKFRIIILTDGLAKNCKERVMKLCDCPESLKCVNLPLARKRLDRDVTVLDPTIDNIIQVTENIYDLTNTSNVTEVNMEMEESIAFPQLKTHISNTVWLIKHFIDDEIFMKVQKPPFIYVVFGASSKIMRMLIKEIKGFTIAAGVEIVTIRSNNDIKYLSETSGRVIILVSDTAEEAFVLDNINIVIDMGLISWKSNVSSIGSNQVRTIWADKVRMIRRANNVERGTVAYPFNLKHLQSINNRRISKCPGYDLEMRYFHDSKQWNYRLNDERSKGLMKRAEDISIRAGLISYADPRYSTPMGSFCSGVLPMLSPRLAKLVLCGIVCGCEDAAVSLAAILAEESSLIDHPNDIAMLMERVSVPVRSEHLAILHGYDRRYANSKIVSTSYNRMKNIERRERLIRTRIKKEGEQMKLGILGGDEEMEKRLLLTLAMAFGDRIGFAPFGAQNGETRFFNVKDPDNEEKLFQFESSTKFLAGEETAGVYYEMRDKENCAASLADVTVIPLTILAAIGNIGGRAVKTTEGLFITTNTGGLHVTMSEYNDVEEMIDMRNEVTMEVQRIALSYLQSDRYTIQFKTQRDKWMDELFTLLTQIPHSL